jgi:hypothetical protein
MKRFLPLFILTGLLFGQDVLLHKSGKNYKGALIGKDKSLIIFRLEGEKSNSVFSINDVDIIVANRGDAKVELYYPFDIEIKLEQDNSDFWTKAAEAYLTGNKDEFLRQNTKPPLIPSYMILPCVLIFVSILVALDGGGFSM